MRVLVVGLLVMAVLTMGFPLSTSAQTYFPAMKKSIVYQDGELVGKGVLVEAYVEDEPTPRAQEETNADGEVILRIPTGPGDFPVVKDLSFYVNGYLAEETPDVDLTTAFEVVDLYVTAGTRVEVWDLPWGLDEDPTAINLFKYPADAPQVTLQDISDSVPAELIIVWHYGGPVESWSWYVRGVGESTLLTLDPGEIYVGVATSATSWEIPQ